MNVLRRIEWLARKRMQGTLSGKHTSPDKGFSVEFAEHREYSPGDDPRNLDWRVMAKNDRNVIKQYIEETYGTGWIKKAEPVMPPSNPLAEMGPEFTEISRLAAARAGHRNDEQALVDGAEYLATQYAEL